MANNERTNYSKMNQRNTEKENNKVEEVTKNETKKHTFKAVVKAEVLNVRKSPEVADNIVKKYTKGYKVDVIEKNGEWSKVKDATEEAAYVMTKFLEFIKE